MRQHQCAESEQWDIDFYVACARLSREEEEGAYIKGASKQELRFYAQDRAIMLDVIQKASKPCIAFKIFAGGQVFHGKTEAEIPETIRSVYREVFAKLKPSDIAAIGVYQGHKNQIAENVRLFKEVMEK